MSRRGRDRRHHDTDATRPRVPIIPMLDMSFQLLAFGLTMFDLAPQLEEGQYTYPLPKSGSEAVSISPPPDKLEDPPEEFTLLVTADGNGRIRGVDLTRTGQPKPEPLPRELDKLAETLRTRVEQKESANQPQPILDIQFDPDLSYQVVFEVLGAVDRAKFKKVTPNLLGAPKPGTPAPGDPMPPPP